MVLHPANYWCYLWQAKARLGYQKTTGASPVAHESEDASTMQKHFGTQMEYWIQAGWDTMIFRQGHVGTHP